MKKSNFQGWNKNWIQWLVALILIGGVVAYRFLNAQSGGDLGWNFSPMMAIAFCGGLYFSRAWAFILPLSILLLSELFLSWHYGTAFFHGEVLASFGCYGVAIVLGLRFQNRQNIKTIGGGVIFSSLLFYLATNSVSWLTYEGYAKTLSGWWQALTVGVAGYPPTYLFLRNSLMSDILFVGVFVGLMALSKKKFQLHSLSSLGLKKIEKEEV